MATVIQHYDEFIKKHPKFYMIAAEHKFNCMCEPCMAFLVVDGLEQLEEPDQVWNAIRGQEWKGTDVQIKAIHLTADRLL